ncbi:MAG: Phenylacetic acid catabolic protein [Candidatus Limnocylindrales bacterium]
MTDPLALDPVLAPEERTPVPSREGVTPDAWVERFEAHVAAGHKVEASDPMPDEYRTAVLRFVEMHANSELMGVLPEREWLMRAPTLRRKLALTAKVQDEVGHAQLLYRIAEDLGKSREAMFDDLIDGRTKFHNVFHYPTRSWADVGIIAWLVDAAAIVAQQALRDGSYGPYARTMRKICWEESVHIMHGRDVVLTMVTGTAVAARGGPGRARPLVGPADADARPALAAREGPRPALADQGQDLGRAAPGIPDDLRASPPRDSGWSSRIRPFASTKHRPCGSTPSRTGMSCGPS